MIVKQQQGFSLVELMIAMTIGIVLTFGIAQVYTQSKETYRTQGELSRLQENARYALDILARDIRMAGFAGCRSVSADGFTITEVDSIDFGSNPSFNYSASGVVTGHEDETTMTLPPGLTAADIVDDTHFLTVQSAGRCSSLLNANMADENADIQLVNANCGFQQNDIVIVQNCTNRDLFRITNTPATSGTPSLSHSTLSTAYTMGGVADETAAEVLSFSSNTYYIRNDTSGIPALFVIDNTRPTSAQPLALIEGVENMKVEYGLDVDGSGDGVPDVYVRANSVGGDWEDLMSIRITLLMRTIEDVGAQATTFDLGTTTVNYAAGPLRKQFVKTVQLRNMSRQN